MNLNADGFLQLHTTEMVIGYNKGIPQLKLAALRFRGRSMTDNVSIIEHSTRLIRQGVSHEKSCSAGNVDEALITNKNRDFSPFSALSK